MHVCIRVCSTLIVRRVRIARPLGMCTRMRSYRPVQDPFHDLSATLLHDQARSSSWRGRWRRHAPSRGCYCLPWASRAAIAARCCGCACRWDSSRPSSTTRPSSPCYCPFARGGPRAVTSRSRCCHTYYGHSYYGYTYYGYPLDQGGTNTLLLRWLQLNGYANSGAAHAAVIRIDARRYVHAHRHIDQPRAQRAGTTYIISCARRPCTSAYHLLPARLPTAY